MKTLMLIKKPKRKFPFRFFGAQTRNRTTDTEIFSLLLYRLSYLGTWAFKDSNLGPTGYEPGALTN